MAGTSLHEVASLPAGWPPRSSHPWAASRLADTSLLRHDVIVHRDDLGRLIGANGANHKRLSEETGCTILIIDDVAPPGFKDDERAVVIMGERKEQVLQARGLVRASVRRVLGRAAKLRNVHWVDLRGLTPDAAVQRLSIRFDGVVNQYQRGSKGASAKPSSDFQDWRIRFDPTPVLSTASPSTIDGPAAAATATAAESKTLRAALGFLAANGIRVAKRGDMRYQDNPSLRISADALQQAASRIARARVSSNAARGMLIRLGMVGSAFAAISLVPRLLGLGQAEQPPNRRRSSGGDVDG